MLPAAIPCPGTGTARRGLLLFARSGFTAALRCAAAARPDLELIDLPRG